MQSMKGATKILSGMNRSMNLPQLSKIAMDFERENDIMDQRQELMEDAVDDALGFEEDDLESDEIINQTLDEIGVDLNQQVLHNLCFVSTLLIVYRWVTPLPEYRAKPFLKHEWRKRSVAGAPMMTSKPV